jgi:hypothetical protein
MEVEGGEPEAGEWRRPGPSAAVVVDLTAAAELEPPALFKLVREQEPETETETEPEPVPVHPYEPWVKRVSSYARREIAHPLEASSYG